MLNAQFPENFCGLHRRATVSIRYFYIPRIIIPQILKFARTKRGAYTTGMKGTFLQFLKMAISSWLAGIIYIDAGIIKVELCIHLV